MKWQPRNYQRRALEFMRDNARCAVWMSPGLGKTSTTGTFIEELLDRFEVSRVLWVATKRIAEDVVPVEFAKWDHLSYIPIRALDGTPKQRERMVHEHYYGVETITYELLAWLMRMYRERGRKLPWQMIVFDESSKLKAPGTQRFRALRRKQPDLPKYVIELTGSPAPQGLLNVWAPSFILDAGQRLGRTYPAFKERYFRPADFMGWRFEPRPGAVDAIHAQLKDITISMRAEDYLELPELVITDINTHLPHDVRALYQQLEQDMFLQLEHGAVEVANGGVLTGKCRQVANGALYLDGGNDRWQVLHDAKLDALDDIVEELEGNNLIVAYQFKSDLARLQDKYKHAVSIQEKDAVARWNAGEIQMLLLHPASAGHGLNLQHGGSHLALFGCPWSHDQYEQSIARIAGGLRRERTTFVYRILTNDTVDADVVRSLAEHRALQEVLKERMRKAA